MDSTKKNDKSVRVTMKTVTNYNTSIITIVVIVILFIINEM